MGLKVFFFIFFFICSALFAKPVINSSIKHYYIYPKSKSDLKRELFSKTPIRIKGRKYLGLTNWKINFNYKTKKENNRCKIDSLNIQLDVIITLPKIAKKHKVSYNTKSSFKKFYKNLYKHEKKHKKYALEAVKESEKKILSVGSEKSCKKLKNKINIAFKKVIEKYKKKNRLFDKRTDHGHTQGADIRKYI